MSKIDNNILNKKKMFTGIIEEIGILKKIKKDNKNLILDIGASFLKELKVNQSISHNGICLTIINLEKTHYTVCVVYETIIKTNILTLKEGDLINLERCLKMGDRIDGHIVQGHIDNTIECIESKDVNGSWNFSFKYPKLYDKYLIPKGSIALNGVSLTITSINQLKHTFSVTIIPYTLEHTNFKKLKSGDLVNVEFDLVAKQIAKLKNV